MAEDSGEKTEAATPRKREQAREKGNVPKSKDLTAAALMMAAAAVLATLGPALFADSQAAVVSQFGRVSTTLSRDDAVNLAAATAMTFASLALPTLLTMAAAALAANVLQVGILFSAESLQPNIGRLSPLANAKQIVSSRAGVKLLGSLGKLALLGGLATWGVCSQMGAFLSLPYAGAEEIAGATAAASTKLAFQLASALLVLAIADFAFQRWKHAEDLKMTKQEIRDEMKNMEGDPLTRQRRREAHRKLASSRELAAVPAADVVITNPTHYSIAVKYDPQTMPAPVVVAKGVDERALKIRKIAKAAGVPVIERPPLARRLWADVKAGESIPLELYDVFVDVLAYVYQLTGRTPGG